METWYLSYKRFENRIVRRWIKRKFKYNKGNINILKYAYRTTMFWASVTNKKVSKANFTEPTMKLF